MDKLAKVRAEVARIQLYTQSEVLKQVLDYIDKVQEEPVSEDLEKIVEEIVEPTILNAYGTKELARRLRNTICDTSVSEDLGKVGSLKSLEYYPEKKTTNKTSKGVFDANMPRRKAYLRGFKDGAHAHKELIANKPVSEDLEKAEKEWLIPQLDKSYADYGETKMMELTHFDGYAMLDAIEFGAQWQKEQMTKK